MSTSRGPLYSLAIGQSPVSYHIMKLITLGIILIELEGAATEHYGKSSRRGQSFPTAVSSYAFTFNWEHSYSDQLSPVEGIGDFLPPLPAVVFLRQAISFSRVSLLLSRGLLNASLSIIPRCGFCFWKKESKQVKHIIRQGVILSDHLTYSLYDLEELTEITLNLSLLFPKTSVIIPAYLKIVYWYSV